MKRMILGSSIASLLLWAGALRAELALPAFEISGEVRQTLGEILDKSKDTRYKAVEERARKVMETLHQMEKTMKEADHRAHHLGHMMKQYKRMDMYHHKWVPMHHHLEGVLRMVEGTHEMVHKEFRSGLQRAREKQDYSKIEADLAGAHAMIEQLKVQMDACMKACMDLDAAFRAEVKKAMDTVGRFKALPVIQKLHQWKMIHHIELDVANQVSFAWMIMMTITKEAVSEPTLREVPQTFEGMQVKIQVK